MYTEVLSSYKMAVTCHKYMIETYTFVCESLGLTV